MRFEKAAVQRQHDELHAGHEVLQKLHISCPVRHGLKNKCLRFWQILAGPETVSILMIYFGAEP